MSKKRGWRGVGKFVNSVATPPAAMEMCISRSFPKWCLHEISELDYFSERLLRKWTGSSGQRFRSTANISDMDGAALLDPFCCCVLVFTNGHLLLKAWYWWSSRRRNLRVRRECRSSRKERRKRKC